MQTEEIVELIRSGENGRNKVIKRLYYNEKLRNGIKKVMRISASTEDDFNHVFNYTLVQFLKAVVENPNFKIKTNVNSYLYGIARNIWLNELRKKRKNITSELVTDDLQVDESADIDLIILNEEKKEILNSVLSTLGTKCKEVLMYWASGYKMIEIAKLLGYSSDSVVRKKKFNCMKSLAAKVHDQPHLKNIFN